METEIGYPMSLWILASWMSFIPSCDGKRTFRVISFLQGIFNLVFTYFIIQFGLSLLNMSSLVVINGIDISPIVGWAILLFGIYLIPLMLYSGVIMIFTGLFEGDNPNKFRIYYESEKEMHKMHDNFFRGNTKKKKKTFLDLLNDEQREILTRFIITHVNLGKDKKCVYADYYYREGRSYEIEEIWFKNELDKEIKKSNKKKNRYEK